MTPIIHERDSLIDLRPGDRIYVGDIPYTVHDAIAGGMGLVLFAKLDSEAAPRRFSIHGLEIALKIIRPDCVDERSRNLFQRELTIWSGFDHENVLRLKRDP